MSVTYRDVQLRIGEVLIPTEGVTFTFSEGTLVDGPLTPPLDLGPWEATATLRGWRASPWVRFLHQTRGQRRARRRRQRGRVAAQAQRIIRGEHRRGNRFPVAAAFVRELARAGALGPGVGRWETLEGYLRTMRNRRGMSGGGW